MTLPNLQQITQNPYKLEKLKTFCQKKNGEERKSLVLWFKRLAWVF